MTIPRAIVVSLGMLLPVNFALAQPSLGEQVRVDEKPHDTNPNAARRHSQETAVACSPVDPNTAVCAWNENGAFTYGIQAAGRYTVGHADALDISSKV